VEYSSTPPLAVGGGAVGTGRVSLAESAAVAAAVVAAAVVAVAVADSPLRDRFSDRAQRTLAFLLSLMAFMVVCHLLHRIPDRVTSIDFALPCQPCPALLASFVVPALRALPVGSPSDV
jgi:hypothetical protein